MPPSDINSLDKALSFIYWQTAECPKSTTSLSDMVVSTYLYSGVILGRFLQKISSKQKTKWPKGYLNLLALLVCFW